MVGKTAGSNNDKDSGGGSGCGIADTCYTGFTVRAPEYARKCRVVRGRRYRLARTSGMRVNLRPGVSPVSDVSEISETTSPSPPASYYGAMKSVGVALAGGVLAFAIALDFASLFAATLATFAATLVICAWFGVGPTLAPADGIGIDKAPTTRKTRNRSGRRVAGRRRARRHRARHRSYSGRRHGRGRGGRAYLKRGPGRSAKISRKRGRGHGRARGISRGRGFGLALVRGGAHPGDEQEEFDDISSFKQFSMNTAGSSLERLLFSTEGDEYFGNVGHEVISALFILAYTKCIVR